MKNIAKRINAAARPVILSNTQNLRTRIVQSKKNNVKLERRNWKQGRNDE